MKLIFKFKEHFRDSYEALVRPSRFFKEVSRKGMYDAAFKFALKNLVIFSMILGLFLVFLCPDKETFFVSLIMAVGLVVAGVIELFVFSFSFHVFLRVLGARKGFDETFCVVAYSTVVLLYAWVAPLLVFAPFHAAYILSSGFMEVHKVSRMRAIFSVVAPIAIGGLLLFLLALSFGFERIVEILRVFYSVRVF